MRTERLIQQFALMAMAAGLTQALLTVRTDQPLWLNQGMATGALANHLNGFLRSSVDFSLDEPDQDRKYDH